MMLDAFCVYHHFIISITKRLLCAILFIKLSYLSAIYDKSYGCMIYRHIPLFALQARHITPRRETKNWDFTGVCHKIEKHRISRSKKYGVHRAEGGTRSARLTFLIFVGLFHITNRITYRIISIARYHAAAGKILLWAHFSTPPVRLPHIKKITSQKTGYFFCRRWDSNPHAFDGGGF